MECPVCSNTKSRVLDKRKSPEGIRRRRECLKCKQRFTTYEKIAQNEIWVIKKDGTRERFEREKLKKGFEKACEKRPVAHEKIVQAMNEIEELLRKKGKKEVKSSTIGELVMKKLKKLDNVAYIRFASVYKDFKDVNDFKTAIKEI